MATLFFCVWDDAAEVALGRPILEEAISILATSSPSTSVIPGDKKRHKRVRVFADADCFVTWGAGTPIAKNDGTDGRPLTADSAEYFDILEGDKLAVIERT